MISRWKIFCLIVAISVVSSTYAQPSEITNKNILFEQLPDKLGLSQSSINCILQDSKGFLWIGTWSGLIRYDGYATTVFHATNAEGEMKSNKITTIYEDKKGIIWVGTQQGGLFRHDRRTTRFENFKNTPDKTSISDDNIWSIQEDKAGFLWIGTQNGLNLLDQKNNSFKRFHNVPNDLSSLAQNTVTDIFLSSNGELWIGTAYGLHLMKTQTVDDSIQYRFENHLYNEDLTNSSLHQFIHQIVETKGRDGKPIIWFTTQRGLKKLENGKIINYLIEGKTLGHNLFRTLISVEPENQYLIVGSEMGLNFFDTHQNRFTKLLSDFDRKSNLSHTTVTSLHLDRGGVLWVGTKKGLNKFDTYSKNFDAYSTASFDPTRSIITGLKSDYHQNYWVSTMGGGLFRFDRKTFHPYKIQSEKENDFTNFIQTIFTDTRRNVWIGTAGDGLYRFNESQITSNNLITKHAHFHLNSLPKLSDDYVMSVEEDFQGNIWVGTWSGGLNKITPEGKIQNFTNQLLIQAPLIVMRADKSGNLWIGTRGNGLYKMKLKDSEIGMHHFSMTDKSAGLTNNFINAIYEDHAGRLWIGTEEGLCFFDTKSQKFNPQTIPNGYASKPIVSIEEDDKGRLWLGHWDGLTVINPSDSTFSKNYDGHDRIQGGFFYSNVSFKDESGRLLFGGSNGFNIINPADVVARPLPAYLVVQNFQIFNKPIAVGEELEGRVILNKPMMEMSEIQLKHFENSISFEFTSLDYAAPEKVLYSYILEGFDKDWNYTTSERRFANYTNLNNGEYTFKVKATNIDGDWGNNLSELKLVIQPPWWKTVWAALLYFVAGVILLHYFRKLILMRATFIHDLKFERLQLENLENLNKAKLQFFTNISHEFRTPLTLILGPVQSLIESGESSKLSRDQLLTINNNAQRLLRLVNQLLDFRKSESGNLKLKVGEGNLVRFVKEIKLSFDGLAEKMNIEFTLNSSSSSIQVWFDHDQFEKVFYNLLSNAFKNTPDGGKVRIQIVEEISSVSVIIEDNGRGIKSEHFESIFQTFFSYDESSHQTGTGIGLALAKSLIDSHHGSIEVESEENIFTRFRVRILKGNDHFDKSDLLKEPVDLDPIENYPILDAGDLMMEATVHDDSTGHMDELPKLLIVEDNHEVRRYIKSIFFGRYLILEAENGKIGLEIAVEEIPDIIISDIMMPIMDGIALCSRLKENFKTSHIPVLLLTARTSLIFKVEGLETGADDYITKPFSPKVLQLKVRNLLRTRESQRKMFQSSDLLDIDPKHVTLSPIDEGFIKRIMDSVEKNMSIAEFSVEELGTEVGLSKTQLYRKLKALTGQSGNEFIRTMRLKRAAQLIEQNQLTIAEVTYEVGFNDLQYFRECFKKFFGLTPSEYAQKIPPERMLN